MADDLEAMAKVCEVLSLKSLQKEKAFDKEGETA